MRNILLTALWAWAAAYGQAVDCQVPRRMDDWVPCRAMQAQLQQKLIGSSNGQSAQPSVAASSTSLIDRTSGPDLASAAFQMFGGSSRDDTAKNRGDGVVSASAYALYTSFSGLKPLDPSEYARGVNWRRVSFSLGYENPPEGATDVSKHKVMGVKVLLVNRRDAAGSIATREISTALNVVGGTARKTNIVSRMIREFLYEAIGNKEDPDEYPLPFTLQSLNSFLRKYLDDATFARTLAKLTPAQFAEIDRIIERQGLAAALAGEDEALSKMAFNIRRAPQVSISWQANLRSAGRNSDIHRAEVIFDWGVWKAFEVTVNGGFDYTNSRAAADTRSGRLAAEGRFELNRVTAVTRGVTPWVLAFAGEQNWVQHADDVYKVQGRLEIPLISGVTLPLSLTYASRSELIHESDVRGQIGFTIDAAKILSALTRR